MVTPAEKEKKRQKKEKNRLTEDEVKAILEAAALHPRDYLILRLFCKTGLRQGELFRIKKEDIQLKRSLIYVPIAKYDSVREVPIDDLTAELLRQWLRDNKDAMKTDIWGKISERTLRRIPGRYARSAGINKKVSCHSLRHFFCTELIRNGVSEFRTQKLMGHRSVATTLLYTGLVTEDCLVDYRRVMNKW